MKVFTTGATGYIGSAVTKELTDHCHEVWGLARSDAAKQRLAKLGAVAFDGSLEDVGSLKRGAQSADAVIHLAFVHNFADFAASAETDKRAIDAIGEALAGSNKPFIVTSGVPSSADGHLITENDESGTQTPRRSEQAALPFAERGVRVSIVRPSRFVHGEEFSHGFITELIRTAHDKGVSAYVGGGENKIHAGHRLDLAVLYRLALENGKAGAKYQAVGDFALPYREVADAIGKILNVPTVSISADKAMEHFGFLGAIVGADNPASSLITQAALGWKPIHTSLLEDIAMGYSTAFRK